MYINISVYQMNGCPSSEEMKMLFTFHDPIGEFDKSPQYFVVRKGSKVPLVYILNLIYTFCGCYSLHLLIYLLVKMHLSRNYLLFDSNIPQSEEFLVIMDCQDPHFFHIYFLLPSTKAYICSWLHNNAMLKRYPILTFF